MDRELASRWTSRVWSACPGGPEDYFAKISTLEVRVLKRKHIIIHGAESAVCPVLHSLVEGIDDVLLEARAARVSSDNSLSILVLNSENLDVVVANAGRGAVLPITEITEEHVDEVFGLNLKAVLFTVQKALPLMRDGSSIIIVSTIASVKGFPGRTAYAAAKELRTRN